MNTLPEAYIENSDLQMELADSIALRLFGKRKRVVSVWYLQCAFSLDYTTAHIVCEWLRRRWRYKIEKNTSFSNYATAKYNLDNFTKHLTDLPLYQLSCYTAKLFYLP